MNQEFLYHTNLIYILPGLIVFFIAISALSHYFAAKKGRVDRKIGSTASDMLPTTILGLLALLLGFTFSMSISRYDDRNMLVVKEANAIGTAYLRSEAFPNELGGKYKELLKEYTFHRLSYFQKIRTEYTEYQNETHRLQNLIWKQTVLMVADRTAISGFFMQANNELIDIDSERVFASENHVPELVFYVIILITALGIGTLSYTLGLRNQQNLTPLILSLLFSVVITLIQDLDRPGRGLIQAHQGSMIRTYEGIK
jgi:hypothetical protein